MGQKMLEIFELVSKEGGFTAQMRLAMLTGIPSTKAKTEPDTPENLKKFAAAYKEITSKNCPIT